MHVWAYSIAAVFLVSLISLVGIFTLSIDQKKVYQFLIYFVSLSAGTLMGDAFIHLIPEAYKDGENATVVSISILSGILVFFILEKMAHWRHCHEEPCAEHPHPFSYIILVGDSIHNFIDGIIIAASFIASVPIGIATTLAVLLHEIPQEIGDFGSLVYGGFSRERALFFNFITALTAVLGTVLVLAVNFDTRHLTDFLIPFAAGGFIYIAGTDLIPELNKHSEIKKGIFQVLTFVLGIGIMLALTFFE